MAEQRPKTTDTLTQSVAEYLRQRIVSGVLRPGARIGQDEVARACNTSRIPVREALQRLEAEGLVTTIPHVGARVIELSVSRIVEAYLIREHLEPVAVELSVPALTAEDRSELRRLHDEMDLLESKGEYDEWSTASRSFHTILTARANSPMLLKICDEMWNCSRGYGHMATQASGRTRTANMEHELILSAVELGDALQASMLTRFHIRRPRLELEKSGELFLNAAERDTRHGVVE